MKRALLLLPLLALGCAGAPPVEELDYDRCWQEARLCLGRVEHPATPKGERSDWAARALAHADRATALEPERVEGHYYRAVALGRVLEHATLPPLSKISELEAAGQRARSLDPAFNCAGALRLLALLYYKAPSWPIGPASAGDEELIESLFEEALRRAPGCPENLIGYAEYLHDQGRNARALDLAEGAALALADHPGLEAHERGELQGRVRRLLDRK